MSPRIHKSLSTSQANLINKVQLASGSPRSTTNTTAAKGSSAAKRSHRGSFASKISFTGNARSDMEAIFNRLLNCDRVEGVDAYGMKGIYSLCGELGIQPDSFEMYALIWKIGVTRGDCVPRVDWLKAMYTYKIGQLHDLKRILVEWVEEARGDSFKEFYNALYDFIRGEGARLMPHKMAVKAWAVLFQGKPCILPWINWCSTVYKQDVTRDLWRQIEVFLSTVPTNEAYSADGKWPTAIDNYVEWCKSSFVIFFPLLILLTFIRPFSVHFILPNV
ncbi:DCN1-like protein 2 [Trypanosoma rangeli]|uniref:Defective in cullin neddylation protein n=1 Tax=Trypanosoma rangeli TaxID=5698 RepID=A0A3R7K285_TRYRA|nr:DCN1-like protein 2 [Trypanosoma rangeli]RNF00512.1 DCN1-like protein 2 [Trypanosoma rangeli]|eukprot:RNF00512.1 DCN1-like protein 2 [Trypanosoma rangeli]